MKTRPQVPRREARSLAQVFWCQRNSPPSSFPISDTLQKMLTRVFGGLLATIILVSPVSASFCNACQGLSCTMAQAAGHDDGSDGHCGAVEQAAAEAPSECPDANSSDCGPTWEFEEAEEAKVQSFLTSPDWNPRTTGQAFQAPSRVPPSVRSVGPPLPGPSRSLHVQHSVFII